MLQVFRIDQTRINNIRNRALYRTIKIALPAILIVSISQYSPEKGVIDFLIAPLFTVLVLFFAAWSASKRIIKSYGSLEIVLNETGVEFKGDMLPFKQVLWENLKIQEKKSGIIYLDDITVSPAMRYWYGRGRIVVQPEIMDREKLLSELWKRNIH